MQHFFFLSFALLSTSICQATTTQLTTVNITDGEHLKKYLCSPEGTISPYTQLIILYDQLRLENLTDLICLVENTTDIYITGWTYFSSYNKLPVHVSCDSDGSSGFSFFNVTNLTLRSVYFEGCGRSNIPAAATKYIDGPNQFFYYNFALTTFLFNHCYNLTLYDVFGDSDYITNENRSSIIGVNICGWSNITAFDPDLYSDQEKPRITLVIYYVDSIIKPSACNLHIKSNLFTGTKYTEILQDIVDTEHMPVLPIRDLALFIAQQTFQVHVNISVPLSSKDNNIRDCYNVCPLNAIIMFVNSVTDSHVTFQGYPYEFCTDTQSIPYIPYYSYRSVQLDVIFYETPSFNGSLLGKKMSPLLIRNTSFMFRSSFAYSGKILRVLQFSNKLSYEVVMENVAWCTNTITFNENNFMMWLYLMYVQSFGEGSLILKMKDVYVQNNSYDGPSPLHQLNSESLLQFVDAEVYISGVSYFGENGGGSVMNVVSSNLTLTGDLSVCDGHAYKGGGIRLDGFSYLFLEEPLVARFINNSAQQGSAIYAPIHAITKNMRQFAGELFKEITTSAIQILPIEFYTLTNVSRINISIFFFGSEPVNSLYAPDFSFFGAQISPYFLFDYDTWDSTNSQFSYTTLIDAIYKGEDMDKYNSLSNGVCIGVMGQKLNCSYIDQTIQSVVDHIEAFAYPGQSTISLHCADNKQYHIATTPTNELYTSIQYVPCETKKYNFFRTSLVGNNLSVLFNLSARERQYATTSHDIIMSNPDITRSVTILDIEVLNQCPLGFNLTKEGICDCIDAFKIHKYKCNINTQTFTSQPHYWTASFNYTLDGAQITAILLSSNCPPNYCKSLANFQLNDSLSDLFCRHNRTGQLCGQCETGLSVLIGSDACGDCSNLYLLTLPVYALAGLALVVILFALRLTVATGTINGVIFYANVLDVSMDLLSNGKSKFNVNPLRIIISLLNLNLGFPLCLYEGMTTAGKAGLQFVFPVYLWTIVLSLIIASKFSVRLSNSTSHLSVQVLATVFYLSFSKITRTAIYIMSSSTVFFINYFPDYGDPSNPDPLPGFYLAFNDNVNVWYYDGSKYGIGVHGFLIFLAIIFAVIFALPYSTLLTFSYYLLRFRLINKFRPFFDAYGGPFKDKWKIWFGLRLWITAILLSVDGALQGTNSNKMLIAHFTVILFFILLQAHIRPFKNQLVGALDLFFMLNYLLIVVFYLQFMESDTFMEAYLFFLTSAVFMLVLILLSHFFYYWIYLKKQAFFVNLKMNLSKQLNARHDNHENEAREDSDVDLFQAAEERDNLVVDTY